MKPSHYLPWDHGDVEAQFTDLAGETGGEAVASGPVEVVGTEVGVCDAAPEHPVDSGKDGSGNREDGFA